MLLEQSCSPIRSTGDAMRVRGFRRGAGVFLNTYHGPPLSGAGVWTMSQQVLSATGGVITTPASMPNVVARWRADQGQTLVQGPVSATGTAPPAVTFAGTPSSSTNTIVLTCTGTGTNTTATFSWTLNGVSQTPFTAASTVVLTGTGITATFPTGTYSSTPSADTYTSVVTSSAWADQSGNGHTLSQATAANQMAYGASSGPNSTPAMIGTAALQTFMATAAFTLTQAYWIWIVCRWTSAYSTTATMIDGLATNLAGMTRLSSTSFRLYSGVAGFTYSGATPQTYQAYGLTVNGASSSIVSNGTTVATGTVSVTNQSGLTVGAGGADAAIASDCLISEIVIASAVPAANVLSAYSQARYGFG